MTILAVPETKWLSPAELVFARFGGYYRLAKMLGISHTTCWRWTQPAARRKRGARWTALSRRVQGQIPTQYQGRILALAKEQRIKIKPQELIEGGRE